jgi:signal transduction histidine kinase
MELNPINPPTNSSAASDLDLIADLLRSLSENRALDAVLPEALRKAAAYAAAAGGILLRLDAAGNPIHPILFTGLEPGAEQIRNLLLRVATAARDDLNIEDTTGGAALGEALGQNAAVNPTTARCLLGTPVQMPNTGGYLLLFQTLPGAFSQHHLAGLRLIAAFIAFALRQTSPQDPTAEPGGAFDLWVTGIFHDLRSPITNLAGSLQGLRLLPALTADPAADHLLGIAERSVQRLDRLSQAILDARRLQSGHYQPQLKPISPVSLISTAATSVETLLAQRLQTLQRVEANLPEFIRADCALLERVLINLLENAARYAPEGTRITLSATGSPEAVLFSVQDEGPGISADRLPLIFTPYQPEAAGSGLGLAFCKLAVTAHGGKIWVENLPDHGSIFNFTIPLPADPPSAE